MDDTNDTTSGTKRKWTVWYVDDELEPTPVKAENRTTAASVGWDARNAPVAAVVAEDEGANFSDLDEDEFATEADPTPPF